MKKQKRKVRKGIAALIYYKKNGGAAKFLLLKRKLNWKGWEWCKGGIKGGESEFGATEREMREETGRESGYIIKKTAYVHLFKYQKEFLKDNKEFEGARNVIFLVRFFDKKVRSDRKEHSSFRWVDKKTALKLLSWPDQRKMFRKIVKKYKL